MNSVALSIEDYNDLHQASVILGILRTAVKDGTVQEYNFYDFTCALLNVKPENGGTKDGQ